MLQVSHAAPISFCMPEWAMTKLVSSSLIGVWLLTGSPSFCAAHCSQRCFSIFLPPLISVRCTVAVLLQLSHFMRARPLVAGDRPRIAPRAGQPIVFPPPPTVNERLLRSNLVNGGVFLGFPHLDLLQSYVGREAQRSRD